MSNPISDERTLAASELEAALPAWHIYASPPASIVPPCVVLAPAQQGFSRTGHGGRIRYPFEAWLYTTGADEGSLEALEQALCWLLAVYLSAQPGNAPGAASYGGQTFLGASLILERELLIPVTAT